MGLRKSFMGRGKIQIRIPFSLGGFSAVMPNGFSCQQLKHLVTPGRL